MPPCRFRVRALAAAGLLAVLSAGVAPSAVAAPAARRAGTGTPSLAASCGSLALGSSGPAVATIQAAIGADADGQFGPATEQDLKHWQRHHGVPVTGVVDPATWAALPQRVSWQACGQQVNPVLPAGQAKHCASLESGDVGPAVAVLQAAVGTTVDGGFGRQTARAVLAAQQAHQLPASGRVGYKLWRALHLTATPACEFGPAGPPTPPPPPPPDAKKQRRIRNRVQRIVAGLSGPARTSNPVAKAALHFARQQLGKPYRYGAEGPKNYDCSGLVMASYDAAAVPLPRVAADQYAAGPRVPLAQVQRGDLVFWASDVADPTTIYHTAIYVGDGRVIDAPHTGEDVQVQPLWPPDLLPRVVRPVAGLALPVHPGDTGATVRALQTSLAHHGFEIPVDGEAGPQTVAAVRQWRTQNNFHPSGKVTTKVWLSLGWLPGH